MRRTIMFAVIAAATSAAHSELVSDSAELALGQGIVLDTRQIAGAEDRAVCEAGLDFVYSDYETCCLMLCCHCGLRFASSTELYLSKVSYDSVSFEQPLDLQDTVAFQPGEAIGHFSVCSGYPCVYQSTGCQPLDRECYERAFFVVRTVARQYAVVRIRFVWKTRCQPPYTGCDPILNSYYDVLVSWVIQRDGSLNFGDMVPLRDRVVRGLGGGGLDAASARYSINGRRLAVTAISGARVVILRRPDGRTGLSVCR